MRLVERFVAEAGAWKVADGKQKAATAILPVGENAQRGRLRHLATYEWLREAELAAAQGGVEGLGRAVQFGPRVCAAV